MWVQWRKRLICGAVLGSLPVFLCLLYCAVYEGVFWNIYLPSSLWNDELLYYKQVEGILSGGVPGGYFGYNESQAQVLSFASWSPILMTPWVVWGKLFGWNFFSPVLCNMMCLMAGMFVFGCMTVPGRKQIITIALSFCLFTPLTRFILSCTPEIFCCSLTLCYIGCLFAYDREGKTGYLWQMNLSAGILTLMRPYFWLFLLYPIAAMKKYGKGKCLVMACNSAIFLTGYILLKRFLSAPYLRAIIEASFLKTFAIQGFRAGLMEFRQQIADNLWILKNILREALQDGNYSGSLYLVYAVTGLLLLIVLVMEWKNRKKESYCKWALLTTMAYTAMMIAIFFIYSLPEGARHLMPFLLIGFSVLGMYSAKIADKLVWIVLDSVICLFFVIKPGVPYERMPPFWQEDLAEDIETMQEVLAEKMEYTPDIGWENTVIWLAHDIVGENTVVEQWQQLYALPGGCGINYCSPLYVLEHLDTLRSRYIVAIPGGQVERALRERDAILLGENVQIAVYRYEALAKDGTD